jgi:hypothetical protein
LHIFKRGSLELSPDLDVFLNCKVVPKYLE